MPGWIVCRTLDTKQTNGAPEETSLPTNDAYQNKALLDFSPIFLEQYKFLDEQHETLETFPTFLQCLDVFFSHGEFEKQSRIQKNVQEQRLSKAEKILQDQQRRLDAMEEQESRLLRYTDLLEANSTVVQQCIEMIQRALRTSVSWKELTHYVKMERKHGHPLASLIHTMNLEKNEMTLLLSRGDEEAMDATVDNVLVGVPVDLTLSAYQNIAMMHHNRKQMLQKKARTREALKSAIKKANATMKKESQVMQLVGCQHTTNTGLVRLRKHWWFEKFHWFITSNGFLVLAGRDAIQNDMLYKRYLDKNDIFVHADTHGAPACIVKNPENKDIPPSTLIQAGRMSVCRSSAWNQKLTTGAWWVYPFQVSKTVPPGEYIVSGSFIIRGKKTMLPPHKLEMGIGVLFQLGEDSVSTHGADWVDSFQHSGLLGDPRLNMESIQPTREYENEIRHELEKEDEEWSKKEQLQLQKRLEKREKWIQTVVPSQEPSTEPMILQEELSTCACSSPKDNRKAVDHSKKPSLVRRKKGKLKRVKEKYEDQDSDERRIRMSLMGSKPMKDALITTNNAIDSTATNNKSVTWSAEPSNQAREHHDKERTGSSFYPSTRLPKPTPGSAPCTPSTSMTTATTNTEDLRYLTPTPRKGDTLVAAIPVCAPWMTLETYHYKIKLQPGRLKKGQAATHVMKHFIKQAVAPSEKELLRLMNINDVNQALPQHVHPVLP